jgi:hypothetical protein
MKKEREKAGKITILLFGSLTGRIDGDVSRTSFKFCEGICIA